MRMMMTDRSDAYEIPHLTAAQFTQGYAEWSQATATDPKSWWMLSFADPTMPVGNQFVGVCFVQASSLPDAVTVSRMRHINPGGDVKVEGPIPFPLSEALDAVKSTWCYKLLNRAQMAAMDKAMGFEADTA